MANSVKYVNSEDLQHQNYFGKIVLSFITFGIYGVYWLYKQVSRMYRLTGSEVSGSGTETFLMLFIPFYAIYWGYTRGDRYSKAASELNGRSFSDRSGVYLIIFLIVGTFIGTLVLQADNNSYAEILKDYIDKDNAQSQSTNNSIDFTGSKPYTPSYANESAASLKENIDIYSEKSTNTFKENSFNAQSNTMTSSVDATDKKLEQIERLTEMYKSGILTLEEFDTQKAKILNS